MFIEIKLEEKPEIRETDLMCSGGDDKAILVKSIDYWIVKKKLE